MPPTAPTAPAPTAAEVDALAQKYGDGARINVVQRIGRPIEAIERLERLERLDQQDRRDAEERRENKQRAQARQGGQRIEAGAKRGHGNPKGIPAIKANVVGRTGERVDKRYRVGPLYHPSATIDARGPCRSR